MSPAATLRPVSVEAPRAASAPQDRSLRVLLVDGGGGHLAGWRRRLELDGYEVVEAGSPATAAAMLSGADLPDLLLIKLPELELKASEELRALVGQRPDRVPLLLLTCATMADVADAGLDVRECDFILRLPRASTASNLLVP